MSKVNKCAEECPFIRGDAEGYVDAPFDFDEVDYAWCMLCEEVRTDAECVLDDIEMVMAMRDWLDRRLVQLRRESIRVAK